MWVGGARLGGAGYAVSVMVVVWRLCGSYRWHRE